MKRIILLISCTTLVTFACQAQPVVKYSASSFEEPVESANKILLLKNGNTILISTNETVMRTRVYDKSNTLISTQNAPYKALIKTSVLQNDKGQKIKDIKGQPIKYENAFEVNGKVVLLLSARSNAQNLYRYILDPVTGKVLTGEKIASTQIDKSWGHTLSEMVLNDVYTAKDPVSDMYSVVLFNGYAEKGDPDRVKLMTFDGDNKLVKEVVLHAPSTTDNSVHFAGLCMYNRAVYMGTNMLNAKEKSLTVPLCLSVLKEGDNELNNKMLDLSPYGTISDNQIFYNPGTNLLEIFTTTQVDEKGSGFFSGGIGATYFYQSHITIVDPRTLDIKSKEAVDNSLANTYVKEKMGEKDGFNGVIPSFYINSDNSATVIPEEYFTYKGGKTFVTKAGIIKLDNNAKATESYVVRIREYNREHGMGGNTASYYYSYKYLNTPAADYIILNDLDENFEKTEKEKPHELITISDANTILFKMKDGKFSKSYLWGMPNKQKGNNFAMVGTAEYDKDSHTVACIVVNSKDKRARLAWVVLD
jgi:hypothetical protein